MLLYFYINIKKNFCSEMQSACAEWEKILAEHPNDLLALKFAHDA